MQKIEIICDLCNKKIKENDYYSSYSIPLIYIHKNVFCPNLKEKQISEYNIDVCKQCETRIATELFNVGIHK